jgi:drug/metabolite transporter (DMT)-like permease
MFALAAVVLWSTVATAFKIALAAFEPAQLLLIATLTSTLCFGLIGVLHNGWRLPKNRWPEAMLLGLLNPLLYYLVLFAAYDRLPAQIAQPLNYTWVLMLAILSAPFLRQRLDARTLAGLLVSYSGVVLILLQGEFSQPPLFETAGVLLALASTVIWAGYWILNRRSTGESVPLLLWSFAFASLLLLPINLLSAPWPAVIDSLPLAAAVWIGIVEMGITFLLWRQALTLSTNTARTGQLVFLSPFLSLIFIATVLGETVTMWSVGGLVVIVTGILVSGRG